MTITRREILHRVSQRLKLTEQQSWHDIAQSKGMTYLQRLPEAIPEGQFLVHNSAPPMRPLGSHGFRAWLQAQDEHLEPCDCGWSPELGTHYRVNLKVLVRYERREPPISLDCWWEPDSNHRSRSLRKGSPGCRPTMLSSYGVEWRQYGGQHDQQYHRGEGKV